jgi:hypothetical protein
MKATSARPGPELLHKVFWGAFWLFLGGVISTVLIGLAYLLLPRVIHDAQLYDAVRSLLGILLPVGIVALTLGGSILLAYLVAIRRHKRPTRAANTLSDRDGSS